MRCSLSCRIGAPGRHGRLRIEHRGKKLVIDLEQPARFFRGALGFGHNGGNALADETDDIVEHVGIVGIDEVILVRRRAVEPARHVLPSEYGDDAGNRRGLIPLDGLDARMRMRRAQHLEMQHAFHRRQIERVARVARYDRLGERTLQARSARLAGDVLFDGLDPVQRVVDALIAGATAEITLEHARQLRDRLSSKVAAVMIMPAVQKPH